MAACVDKWNPAYSCHRISRSIYRFMPDCTFTAPAGAAVNGNGGCCNGGDEVWEELYAEAQADAQDEPLLGMFYSELVLSHPSLEAALAAHLSAKLCIPGALPQDALRDILAGALAAHPEASQDRKSTRLNSSHAD